MSDTIKFLTGDENLHVDETFVEGSTNPVESREIQRRFNAVEQAISVTGYVYKNDLSELPLEPAPAERTLGYVIDKQMYIYVGVGGNVLDGRYKQIGNFVGPKGDKGDRGEEGPMGQQGPVGPQGDQGNTGSSVDYPFELVNNLTQGGTDKGLTAEMGKNLGSRVGEIESGIVADNIVDFANLRKEQEQIDLGFGTGTFIYKSGSISKQSGSQYDSSVIFELGRQKYLKYRAYMSGNNFRAIELRTNKSSVYSASKVVAIFPEVDTNGWVEGEIDLSQYPTAKYAVFSTRTNTAAYRDEAYCYMTSEGIGSELSQVKESVKNVEANEASLDNGVSLSKSIFSFNSRKQWDNIMSQLDHTVTTTSGSEYPPLILGWFTDIHGEGENLGRMMEFFNAYSSRIDDIICTGDMVRDYMGDGMQFWSDNKAERVLMVPGNHDYYALPYGQRVDSSFTDATTPDVVRENIMEPFINNWGVVTGGSNVNYYYKDYPSHRVRLICLDAYWDAYFDNAQRTWFAQALDGARVLGYRVIVANHLAPEAEKDLANPFCALTSSPFGEGTFGSASFGDKAGQIVKDFQDNGGMFICWIAGHAHSDYWGKNKFGQLVILQAKSCLDRSVQDERIAGTRSQDCINMLSIQTYTGTVTMARVGFNMDKYGRRKDGICYSYSTGKVVSINGSYPDLSQKADKSEVNTELARKQDSIADLSTIRTGAGKGATALQPSDVKAVAKTGSYNDLTDKPSIPDVSGKADKSSVYTKSETYTKSEVNAAIANHHDTVKADKSYVDDELAKKNAKIKAGANVTITDNADGTQTISAQGGGGGSTPVVDSLDSDSATSALSARQGKVLKGMTEVSAEKATEAEASAQRAETYLGRLETAIQSLPDGQAVSAKVAENTAKLGALSDKVDDIENLLNVSEEDIRLDKYGYISPSGAVVSNQNLKRTDYIELGKVSIVKYKLFGDTTFQNYAFFDDNKNYISGSGVGEQAGMVSGVIDSIPIDAKYIMFCTGILYVQQSEINLISSDLLSEIAEGKKSLVEIKEELYGVEEKEYGYNHAPSMFYSQQDRYWCLFSNTTINGITKVRAWVKANGTISLVNIDTLTGEIKPLGSLTNNSGVQSLMELELLSPITLSTTSLIGTTSNYPIKRVSETGVINIKNYGSKLDIINVEDWTICISVVYPERVSNIDELQRSVTELKDSLWKGKKIGFLGDSITYQHLYIDSYIAQTGCSTQVSGINGSHIAAINSGSGSAFENRVNVLDNDLDCVVVFGGTNDYGHSSTAPFGVFSDYTKEDTYSFYAGLHRTFKKLYEKFKGKPIVVITPLHHGYEVDTPEYTFNADGTISEGINPTTGKTFREYVDAIKEVATFYSFFVIDAYSESGLNPCLESSSARYYFSDGLHPNARGGERLARFMYPLMEQIAKQFVA